MGKDHIFTLSVWQSSKSCWDITVHTAGKSPHFYSIRIIINFKKSSGKCHRPTNLLQFNFITIFLGVTKALVDAYFDFYVHVFVFLWTFYVFV